MKRKLDISSLGVCIPPPPVPPSHLPQNNNNNNNTNPYTQRTFSQRYHDIMAKRRLLPVFEFREGW